MHVVTHKSASVVGLPFHMVLLQSSLQRTEEGAVAAFEFLSHYLLIEDTRLPYVLFAYRASPQESSRESPFFLLHGRDPRLPTEVALTPPPPRTEVDLMEYKAELRVRLSEAWTLAQQNIAKAQKRQKRTHDRHARDPAFCVGERVFLHTPSLRSGPGYKFARPYQAHSAFWSCIAMGLLLQMFIDRMRRRFVWL